MKKNIFLLTISFLVVLGTAELILQFYTWKPADQNPKGPRTGWATVPEHVWTEHHEQLGWFQQKNKKAILEKDGWRIEINTNSEGMRGTRDYSIEKRNGVSRILVLGDSFIFGWGVKDDETFSAILEKQIENLEVLNLGVPGYGLDQMLMSYRVVGRKFKPDIVTIFIYPEAFWRATRSFADTGLAKPYFTLSKAGHLKLHNVPVPPKFSLKYNQFPDLIEYNAFESILMRSQLYRFIKRAIIRLGKNFGRIDPESTVEWLIGREILKELIKDVQAQGAVPVLVMVPPHRWMHHTKPTSLQKSMFRFAQREKVYLMDLTPLLKQVVKESGMTHYYIKDDGHWAAEGHHFVSEILGRFLKAHGLVKN